MEGMKAPFRLHRRRRLRLRDMGRVERAGRRHARRFPVCRSSSAGMCAAVAIAGFLLVGTGGPSQAGPLKFEPLFGLTVNATDNLFLVKGPGVGDLAPQLDAGFSLTATGARLQANIRYQAQLFHFTRTGTTDLQHDGAGILRYQVIRRILSFELNGVIRESFTTRAGRFSGNKANLAPGRQTIQSYAAGPDLDLRLGIPVVVKGRYRFGVTLNDSGRKQAATDLPTVPFSDSRSHQASLDVEGSKDRLRRLSWRLFGRFNRTARSNPPVPPGVVSPVLPAFQSWQTGLDLGYALSRVFRIEGSVSWYADNTRFLGGDLDGLRWDAGFRLRGRKLEFAVRGGRRPGQTTGEARLAYQLPRLRVETTYEDAIATSQQLLVQDSLRLTAPLVGPLPGAETIPLPLGPDLSVVAPPEFDFSDRNFRQRRLALTLDYSRRRDRYRARGYFERRTFETGGVAQGFGGDLSWSHDLTATSQMRIEGVFRHDRFENSTRVDNDFIGSVSYGFNLGRSLTGEFRYTHTRRFSNLPEVEFNENAMYIGIRARF